MAGLLPLMRTLSTASFPVTRRIVFDTNVSTALDATEQRSKRRPPLTELVLPYTRINAADLATMRAFVESQKGQFDSSWAMVLGLASLGTISATSKNLSISDPFFTPDVVGQQVLIVGAGTGGATFLSVIDTYTSPTQVIIHDAAITGVSGADTRWGIYLPNMVFVDDNISVTEESATRTTWAFTLRARQTKNPAYATGSTGGSFPTLANGVTTQFPFVGINRYQVMVSTSPVGIQYAWNWWDGTHTFPNHGLHGWELNAPALNNADLATWETFFRNQYGRFATFTFTDPDSLVAYAKCRFDVDQMEIVHTDYNTNSVKLRILETN